MQKIVLIGSQNLGGKLDDGEVIKNYYIYQSILKFNPNIIRIDLRNKPSRLLYLAKLSLLAFFHPEYKYILSASVYVASKILRVIKKLGVKGENVVYWVIGGSFAGLIENRTLNKSLYDNISHILVEGENMRQILITAGFKQVETLPNFKEINYYPQLKAVHGNSSIRFVFLSRILKEKGVEDILSCAKKMKAEGYMFHIDFYGRLDEEYKETFTTMLSDIDCVEYKGLLNLKKPEGYDTLASYDCMLFPTFYPNEGFPGVLIDAFIAGLPVVATDWSQNASIVKNGYSGVIVPAHNEEALRCVMSEMAKGKYDLQTMSEKARAEAKKYDVNYVVTADFVRHIGLI